jgi:Na+-transporting NADH:ubiquinone oxidoreductase subunit A
MGLVQIKKGLDIPICGEPEQEIYKKENIKKVALIGYDYIGIKPAFAVSVGENVRLGQLLFRDKKMPCVKFTSPGTGKVIAINRGPKRVFESIVIELKGIEELTFDYFSENQLKSLEIEKVKSILIESGLWTSLRTRPFSKIANPETKPNSIFVTAMDTNPHAPLIEKIINRNRKDFVNGLVVLSKLTCSRLFLCKAKGANIPIAGLDSLSVEEFSGLHPAGNVGTHIHFLDPVHINKKVWYINAQDVIAIGKLFLTGRIFVERIISLAGPSVKTPRLLETRIGASIDDMIEGELKEQENRVISGSILSGRNAVEAKRFLGRFHQQVSVLKEGRKREFLGWLNPGFNKFSAKNIVLSRLFRHKKFDFTTSINGGKRAIVPIGIYEKVMPLDIFPTFLLRSLIVDDIEQAEKLGCLELDEEDLALCTFVCPSKIDYGPVLRRNLTIIGKEMG